FKKKSEAIAGWGFKDTAKRAMALAEKGNMLYVALEDGFLRSYDLGVNGATALSLVLDKTGIYYNGTKPSDLEELIKRERTAAELARARKCIELIKKHHLSKYNNYAEAWENAPKEKA